MATHTGFLYTDAGLEPTAALEVKHLLGKVCTSLPQMTLVNDLSYKDLITLAYKSQSATRVGLLLCEFNASDGSEFSISVANQKKLLPWLNQPFHVRAIREGAHPYSSLDVERDVGKALMQIAKEADIAPKVEMSSALTLLVIVINEAAYLGVDFGGKDLSKREYRAFLHPSAIKGPLGFHLAMQYPLAAHTILDPCCGSGTILIEAGMHLQGISPHRFSRDLACLKLDLGIDAISIISALDASTGTTAKLFGSDKDLRHVSAAKRNTKLSGASGIAWSRMDVEWLDTKFDRESVHCIISHPPASGRIMSESALTAFYKEFFYVTDFILAPAGAIILLVLQDEPVRTQAAARKFEVKTSHTVWAGKQPYQVLRLEKHK